MPGDSRPRRSRSELRARLGTPQPDENGSGVSTPGEPLRVESIVKTYQGGEGAPVVNGVSFTIEEGQFFTLLGPSGCGKTTTLRCIAGLERIDGGTIAIDDRIVSSRSPNIFIGANERDLGMVFQSYAIWPHMTVFDNVAFPLRAAAKKRRRVPRSGVRTAVLEALEAVQLSPYAERLASKLSGGQQQRLAVARALVGQPRLLLLDEPLSNLDAGLREHMRAELRRLQRELGVTTLYVTHDQSEALSMSNAVAVMNGGHIVQQGSPREIYRRPATKFVATFVGRTNLLDAKVIGTGEADTLRLETGAGVLSAVCPKGLGQSDEASVSVRPEDLRLHEGRPTGDKPNVLRGEVERVFFLGENVEYHITVGHELLISRQHPDVVLRRRQEVYVEFPVNRCVVVTDELGSTDHGRTDDPDAGEVTSLDALETGLEVEAGEATTVHSRS